jgi:hypothetical protein
MFFWGGVGGGSDLEMGEKIKVNVSGSVSTAIF